MLGELGPPANTSDLPRLPWLDHISEIQEMNDAVVRYKVARYNPPTRVYPGALVTA
jgi:hypothetical protein